MIKFCPHCAHRFERTIYANGLQRCCPNCHEQIPKASPRCEPKICPSCRGLFKKANYRLVGEKEYPHCPHCQLPLFYRKLADGSQVVVKLADKLCVDNIIKSINRNGGYDLMEATHRERKFAYDLIEWVEEYLGDQTMDVGLTHYEFIEQMIGWILENHWWKENFKSLLMIKNLRSKFASEYLEYLARQRGVYSTPLEGSLQNLIRKLRAGAA